MELLGFVPEAAPGEAGLILLVGSECRTIATGSVRQLRFAGDVVRGRPFRIRIGSDFPDGVVSARLADGPDGGFHDVPFSIGRRFPLSRRYRFQRLRAPNGRELRLTSGEIPDVRWQVLSVDELWTSKSIIGSTTCGKVFSRKLFSGIRFPVGKFHEDEWTTHKVLFRIERTAVSDAPLYGYRQRPENITAEPWTAKRLRDALDALMNQAGFFDNIGKPALKARCCRRIFRLSCASLDEMEKNGRRSGSECCRRALRFCLRNRGDRRNLPIDHPVYRRAHPIRVRIRKAFPRLDKLLCGVLRTFRQR